MFHGSHAITMDSKGRIAIPAKLRDLLSETCAGRLVATAHTEERCLLIYPEPQWQELVPKIEALPNMNRRARKVQRFLSQPFYVAEVFTGLKGEYVPVAETVESFEALIDGELDDLPEQAFLNVGNIDQVQAKAKALRES